MHRDAETILLEAVGGGMKTAHQGARRSWPLRPLRYVGDATKQAIRMYSWGTSCSITWQRA